MAFLRISRDPAVMGGKRRTHGLRLPPITVGTIVELVARGSSRERILQAYLLLEPADLDEAIALPPGAWKSKKRRCS